MSNIISLTEEPLEFKKRRGMVVSQSKPLKLTNSNTDYHFELSENSNW